MHIEMRALLKLHLGQDKGCVEPKGIPLRGGYTLSVRLGKGNRAAGLTNE